MKNVAPRTKVWLLCFNLGLVVIVAFLLPQGWLPWLIRYGSMPVLAGLLSLFIWVLVRQLRRLPKQAYKKRFSKPILLLLISAAGYQFVHEELGYKILMDEYNLTATSMNMHLEKSAFTPTRGRIVQGEFEVVEGYVDKRPYLYPFLLSIVHDISGYRSTNPFILNSFVNLLLFIVVYLAGFHLGNKRGGVLAVLLLAGLPLIGQNATGAGFELLNFLLLAVTLFLSLSHTVRPGLDKETLLVLAALLLANVRYESILFLIPVVLVIGLRWKSNPKLGPGWISVWAPWFLGPLLLQNRLFRGSEGLWELPGDVTTPFSPFYIPENLGHAVMYFFNVGAEFPNSLYLTIFGFLTLLFLLIVSVKRFRNWQNFRPRDYDVLGLWGLVLIGHMTVILAYHAGQLDSHFATRLGLPIHLILVLTPVWMLVKEKKAAVYWNLALAGAVLFLVTVSAPHSSKAIYTKKNFAEREFRWAYGHLQDQPDPHYLVIDSKVSHWVSMQLQGIHMDQARANRDLILNQLEDGTYREVFVLQRISIDPVEEKINIFQADALSEFTLESVDEYISRPFQGVRLSRIKH